ncbi:hypothetical protein [Acidisoma cladoniae]|uniref:hypothetical protein n=1 Tax=Acidisoma cladoniae TaxID=3040935 RepID=UPI00255098E2|nr:hypothetical protein [Acidisoma sp. PAMC 29798]
MNQRTLREMRPSMRQLAAVLADTLRLQSWPRRWELLSLAGQLAWLRVKITWFRLREYKSCRFEPLEETIDCSA